MLPNPKEIIVVGAGPAGCMAAISAAQAGAKVTLVEQNPSLGKKLLLSGKGRCNLTNACGLQDFLKRFSGNADFLRDAFRSFFNTELVNFFEQRGLGCKTERQLRVFPRTDSSASVTSVLAKALSELKVRLLYKRELKDLLLDGSSLKAALLDNGEVIPCRSLILATGGVTYRFSGSTGAGHKIAARLGHKIIPLRPGLVPLLTAKKFPLEGLALKNIRLVFCCAKNKLVSDIGEMIFTANGVSGPLVLSLSAKVVDWLEGRNKVFMQVDLKPALSSEQLDSRLLREFKSGPKKSLKNILKELVPLSLVKFLAKEAQLDPVKTASHVTQAERRRMIEFLKGWSIEISGSLPIEEAMVTRGGVSLKEVDPRTMESRLVRGLYFAGEILDVDADTGGFNLQAAFSTGYLAGKSAAS